MFDGYSAESQIILVFVVLAILFLFVIRNNNRNKDKLYKRGKRDFRKNYEQKKKELEDQDS
ncbi:hypothetical protein [Croceiramulus getboli]|nr:hypothetical protein P8624_08325 [Flavobacteriaceae bacterium YJPT1-3]